MNNKSRKKKKVYCDEKSKLLSFKAKNSSTISSVKTSAENFLKTFQLSKTPKIEQTIKEVFYFFISCI